MRDELPLASFNKGGEGRKLEESELSSRFQTRDNPLIQCILRKAEA
jgi:hypothetical protein